MSSSACADTLTNVAHRIPYEFERELDFRPLRPPTTVYPPADSLIAWRDEQFPPTNDRERAHVWLLNLEGALLSSESLHDLLVPVARRIRDGELGQAVLVIATSSQPLADAIEDLAGRYELALYLLPSVHTPLTDARPVGPLSPAERETLDFLPSAGGVSTSAQFAKAKGLELAAAGNRFASVYRKGFVARVERPRRQGHQFVDLRVAAASQQHPGIPANWSGEQVDFDVPESVRRAVNHYAELQGRSPSAVLADLGHSYLTTNFDELSDEFRELRAAMANGDSDALREYTTRSVQKEAQAAAERAKRQ
jgi:hypothetical protein